ncbi:unnamed protein product [Rhizopus stolonifer]
MPDNEVEEAREIIYRSFTLNPISVSHELQEFIDFGNELSNVTPFDITVYEPGERKKDRKYTIEELMACGTKLLDACLYQYISNKNRFNFTKTPRETNTYKPSEIGEALFCVFYCLLTKGEIPEADTEESIPKFIRDIFKNPETFCMYGKMLASFDINRLNKSWIKRINLYGIPMKIKHRLSFGVLGHEVLDIYRLFVPKSLEGSKYRKSYYAVMKFASNGPTWDIFPMTGDPVGLKQFQKKRLHIMGLFDEIYDCKEMCLMDDCGILPTKYEFGDARTINDCEFNRFKNYIFTDKILDQPKDDILSSGFTYPLYFSDSLEEDKVSHGAKAFISFNNK